VRIFGFDDTAVGTQMEPSGPAHPGGALTLPAIPATNSAAVPLQFLC
jgi:hypothetical protein